ncbi:unnamed protein product [Didymodactylos carnosus]|uniref:Uncharacterized protein n=1 Tax=Didymodactylos carnosus TaxID=1234261 RepID=A0A814Z9E7_9BILA|nr:unnamed protein product [Didymodactylos carnosus]CAF4000919.1 unnamed protein product [Didymodactylos carnosus]
MISTGVEVSSEPPFEMRDISDGFMKRLPEWLREELKPIDQRKDSVIINSAHRFWIEAGQITYEYHFGKKNNLITYYLSDKPMCVKKQFMQYDEQGNLIDDLSKLDDDHSPEAQFIQRVIELGVLVLFIRSTFENIQKYLNNIRIKIDPVNDYLQRIRNQISYPCATDQEIDKIVNSVLSDQNISYSAVSYEQMNELKTKIRSQLIEADETNLNKIVEAICEACRGSHHMDMLKDWCQIG